MSALTPVDPVPGHPLVFRIDIRTNPDNLFWARYRLAMFPSHSGHVFWVTDDVVRIPNLEPPVGDLARPLMLQFIPPYVRVGPAERRALGWYINKEPEGEPERPLKTQLTTAQLVKRGQLTVLGYNSYFLSP